jgi:hypothetical protein
VANPPEKKPTLASQGIDKNLANQARLFVFQSLKLFRHGFVLHRYQHDPLSLCTVETFNRHLAKEMGDLSVIGRC